MPRKHHVAKLTEQQVLDIRWRYAQGGNTYLSLATEYGVDGGTIGAILRGKSWAWLTGGGAVKAPPRGLAPHCKKGHKYTPQNTIWRSRPDRPNPSRQCRKCRNATVAKRDRRLRGNYR